MSDTRLEGLIIKYTIGAVFIGVTVLFAGKIGFVLFDYFAHGDGFQELAAWIGKVITSAIKNAGKGIKDAFWGAIFGE